MKGFIEVNITYLNGIKKERTLLMEINNIKFITNTGHVAEIITYDKDIMTIEESYEEIKQLIKNAQ